jgi:hypothetical protein
MSDRGMESALDVAPQAGNEHRPLPRGEALLDDLDEAGRVDQV